MRYWSDFNRVFYHPRSIVQINDYELGSSLLPFEKWESGEELFVSIDRDNDLLDRDVRVFAEECDHMQGIQMFTGGDDAWGGFATKYAESLRDEYGKMAIWAWGLEEEQWKGQRSKQMLRMLNAARMINEMSRHASMYVPMSIPATPLPQYVHLDRNSVWHSSALLATALESATLPTRLRPGLQKRGLLGDIEAELNVNGNQRITQLQCSIVDSEAVSRPGDTPGQRDDRMASNANSAMVEEDEPEAFDVSLDINLSCIDHSASSSSRSRIFGAIEGLRGVGYSFTKQEQDDDEVTYARRRQRLLGRPMIERSVSKIYGVKSGQFLQCSCI